MYGFSANGYPVRESFAVPFAQGDGVASAGAQALTGQGVASPRVADSVARMFPFPGVGGGGVLNGTSDVGSIFGAFLGFVQQMFGMLAQLLQGAQPGQSSQAPPAQSTATGPQRYFSGADASSTGDPHDAFSGTSNGARVDSHWDDMRSHQNLLSSDSFRGGYRVSTRVTASANGGPTMNSAATVSVGGGESTVTVNADGSSSILASGRELTLAAGEKADLDNGACVTRNVDGSFTVEARNGNGGRIATTLTPRNGGVDIGNHAENVDLGGYLVNRADDPARPPLMRYTQGIATPQL